MASIILIYQEDRQKMSKEFRISISKEVFDYIEGGIIDIKGVQLLPMLVIYRGVNYMHFGKLSVHNNKYFVKLGKEVFKKLVGLSEGEPYEIQVVKLGSNILRIC